MLKKTLLISCFSFTLFAGNLSTPAYIAYGADTTAVLANDLDDVIVTPMAEQTEWMFRIVDGKYQMRLWSYTYGKWLTEWQWM
ncbi:hypothetical protein [Anaerotignum propionicum]|jgi:hypothetical protein|uniref:hypothetical protein n=1 Tax=Anaerotignum propionicum TaxID=28446 RepID=UPI00289C24D3|nr:hypothetical protein [Anaerotignum propionicum]MEA5057141.1 hypothetical protein [Anaerotignum propionicum]